MKMGITVTFGCCSSHFIAISFLRGSIFTKFSYFYDDVVLLPREKERFDKDLIKIAKKWQLGESNVKVIPNIIGELGSIPSSLETKCKKQKHVKTLEISYNQDVSQTLALLGTV